MNRLELTAPCGLDCFNCELYEENLDEVKRKKFAEAFSLSEEKVACKGCRAQGGCRLHWGNCDMLDCVKEKNVDFCFQCSEFPCSMYTPCVDGADRYTHNIKIFNLCRIKAVGVEKWAEEEAAEVRKKYFKGKFVPGKGPQL
ncbi:MAG: DUF3795 domain-containing protein [Clostridia bacterium]|nr:DUF3795 domain-containing protein [Clostridia bacterium]